MTDAPAQDAEITLGETTQPALSGHRVGVSNIWERSLAGEQGILGPRPSAQLSIMDPATRTTRTVFVGEGDTFELGMDRYRVTAVAAGRTAPGWIVVRKIPA